MFRKTIAATVLIALTAAVPLSAAEAHGHRGGDLLLGLLGGAVIGGAMVAASQPQPVYVQPQPVYVAPPPPVVYYQPAPPPPVVYYAPPPPVYYQPAPVVYYRQW